MDNELKNIVLLHCEMYDVIDGLKGLESMLHVFYHSMVINPDSDIWQDDANKRINLLSDPYITIIDSIKTQIKHLDDIHDRMDKTIMALDNEYAEGRC